MTLDLDMHLHLTVFKINLFRKHRLSNKITKSGYKKAAWFTELIKKSNFKSSAKKRKLNF